MNILSVNHLSYHYDMQPLFEEVSFSVASSKMLILKGENGSGKTTLLKVIAKILKPSKGQVELIKPAKNWQSDFLYLGHENAIWPNFTVLEMLSYYAAFMGKKLTHMDRLSILTKLGLVDFAQLKCKALSFGQQRRLSLARLFMKEACLWILDEPVTGFDEKAQRFFWGVAKDHLRKGGAILMSSHEDMGDQSIDFDVFTLSHMRRAA